MGVILLYPSTENFWYQTAHRRHVVLISVPDCIACCLLGRDVIAQAQSGTGKTATFAVSVLQRIDKSSAECQALIMAPTRELAQQVFVLVLNVSFV